MLSINFIIQKYIKYNKIKIIMHDKMRHLHDKMRQYLEWAEKQKIANFILQEKF